MAEFDKERADLLQASIVAYHELMRYIREDVASAGSVGPEVERELNNRLRDYRDTCEAVTIYDHEAARAAQPVRSLAGDDCGAGSARTSHFPVDGD